MATNFPTSLDSLTNPTTSDTLASVSHSGQHADANDAIEALQVKVGVDNSAVATSLDYLVRSACPIGSVMPFAGSSSPDATWLVCDGSAISRTAYAALFAVLGTTYGSGDGSTTFNIPNMKGRVPVGLDAGQTEFDALGETGGAKTHTLSEAELPAHGHTFTSGNSNSSLNHRHSISHNHAAVTSGSGSSHTHSGSFGSSSHRHNIQIGLHDYYFKASAAYSGMSSYGLSNYNISWAGSYNLASSSETVNTSSSYAAVSHTVFGSIGQSNTPNATAGVGNESSHTHSVDLPSYSGNSSYVDLTNHTHSGTTNDTGSSVAHNNLQPYIALNYILKAA